jgi:hypothetical protein
MIEGNYEVQKKMFEIGIFKIIGNHFTELMTKVFDG